MILKNENTKTSVFCRMLPKGLLRKFSNTNIWFSFYTLSCTSSLYKSCTCCLLYVLQLYEVFCSNMASKNAFILKEILKNSTTQQNYFCLILYTCGFQIQLSMATYGRYQEYYSNLLTNEGRLAIYFLLDQIFTVVWMGYRHVSQQPFLKKRHLFLRSTKSLYSSHRSLSLSQLLI